MNQISYNVPFYTEYRDRNWLEDQYINKKKSIGDIAKLQEVDPTTILKWLKKFGIPIRDKKGKNHWAWKGGKRNDGRGYTEIYKPNHPYAHKNAVLEHKLVMEKHLKRRLWRGEKIHHINGNKKDNRIENLVLCVNKTHGLIHTSLEKCGLELFKKGLIKFDKEKKRYSINE